jgi:hypothetical protein
VYTFDRKQLLKACYSFIVPVARFLLRSGISFREFSELGRLAFVHVAREDYGIRGRPTNLSRVAAMTGISRKDVRRVQLLADEYAEDPRVQLSPLGDVLQHWCTSPDFIDEAGQPRPLPLSGTANCFDDLVHSCGGDLPAGAIKVELLRCGVVSEDADGRLIVKRREIVPKDFDERLITSLAFSLRGLATTIAFNTDPGRKVPGRIERFVQSNYLTEESRELLAATIRDRITTFTEDMDDLLSEGSIQQNSGRRVGIGVFYHED